jgi:hypothetical protein
MQLKSKIAGGDLQVKIDKMRTFLSRGHPVRLIYISKNPDPVIFFPLLQTCVDALILDAHVDEGALSPSKHFVNLSPLSAKKRQALYPSLTPEQKKQFGVYLDDKSGQWVQRGREDKQQPPPKAAEQKNEEDEDEDEEEEEDEEDNDEEVAAPAVAPAAQPPAAPAAPAQQQQATPAAPVGKKEKQQQKKQKAWLVTPPPFSKAAKQAAAAAGGK